jgi:MoaA/NifB/PqqE/SkfB family radical SAM enzyme
MPLRTVEAALDLFANLGIHDVRLTGGEPSIHPEFKRILKGMEERGIRVGLVSNGLGWLKDGCAGDILDVTSRCWISLYGISAFSHRQISRRRLGTFLDTIAETGKFARQGYWIGLSVLAIPGDSRDVPALMDAALDAGIGRLRILPIQPDGRACESGIDWKTWPAEVLKIARIMEGYPQSDQFESLSVNDPFDLAARFTGGHASCLLNQRKMWSVTPDGGIYPCCFTVYSESALLGNVFDTGIDHALREFGVSDPFRLPCHGLMPSFWRGAELKRISCPIGALDPRTAGIQNRAV